MQPRDPSKPRRAQAEDSGVTLLSPCPDPQGPSTWEHAWGLQAFSSKLCLLPPHPKPPLGHQLNLSLPMG